MPTCCSACCSAWAPWVSVGRSLRYAIPVENPLGCPQACSACLALAGSPWVLVVASYSSNFLYPATVGGITVLPISPPATGPPYAFCSVRWFAAYSTACRQASLVNGATCESM
jgi:hypothetical protein